MTLYLVMAGFTGGSILAGSDMPAIFSCKGNLPKITVVMQNLPEI